MSEPAFEDDQRFEILDKLAEGGMGVVYRARHVGLDKLVALKVLNTACNDDTAIVRFQNEAKTLSRLSHRSIAGVYDFGISKSGEPFMAIEFVEGVTLQDLLEERKRLSVDEALPLIIQIAEALAHAHQRGVVHRDIKPSNIIIQENNNEMLAKVVDFGIAKDSFSDTGDLTRTGGLIGSPLYMSPEQTLGNVITPQSDMYSLGCVIYHCLIGKPPFAGETIFDTITKHREAPIPSMRKRLPQIPPELDDLVAKLLSKEPEKRYLSMTVVQKILTRMLEGTVGDSQGNPVIEEAKEEEKRDDLLKATLFIESGQNTKSTRKVAIGIVLMGLVAVVCVAIAASFSLKNEPAESEKLATFGVSSVAEDPKEDERQEAIRRMLKNGVTEYASLFWSNEANDDDMKVFQGTKVAKKIDFTEMAISDHALKYLAESPLYYLNLSNTKVKTLEFVPAPNTLEFLQLTGTKVGDDGLAHLNKFKKLNTLVLDKTAVTASGIKKHLKSLALNELTVNDCPNITASDIDELANEFPMWKVIPWKKEFENKNAIELAGMTANSFVATAKPQKALDIWNHWNSFADSHVSADPKRRLKIRVLTSLAAIYDNMKHWDQAKKVADEALILATKYGSDREMADAHNAVFRHDLNSGNLPAAVVSGRKAMEWNDRAFGDPEMQQALDVGIALMLTDKPAEAIPVFEKSLKAREQWKKSLEGTVAEKKAKTGEITETDMQNIQGNRGVLAITLLHYCNCLRALNRNNEAKQAVEKSIRVLEEVPNPTFVDTLSQDYLTLADINFRLHKPDEALIANKKSIPLFKASPNPAYRKIYVPLAMKQQKQIELFMKANPGVEKSEHSIDKPSVQNTEKPD